jgi:sirohydrochlorin ferrochelatase
MRGIILVDHGSRRDDANARLEEIAVGLAPHCPDAIVEFAHMEIAEPSLAAAFERAISRGATEIVVHPFFLSPGRHVSEDLPRLCRQAAATTPQIPWHLTEATGQSSLIYDAILECIEASQTNGP